jgi:trehalose/maltose hydrolase-like predicted phosphorylase
MAINRYELIKRHNPVLNQVDVSSPLTVGNGEFAFTADVTGLQSLYHEYKETLPLCTMSQWGWHTTPVSEEKYAYTLDDLEMTEYTYNNRKVEYAKKKKPGNEEVYDWLRHNPHRLNLGRIGFLYKGQEIKENELSNIKQELKLYEGTLYSDLKVNGTKLHVETICDYNTDTLAIKIESDALLNNDLEVFIDFPYGATDITASDWNNKELHQTQILKKNEHSISLKRNLDKDMYYVSLSSENTMDYKINTHRIIVNVKDNNFAFCVHFSKEHSNRSFGFNDIVKETKNEWKKYWEEGGIIQLNKSKDERAIELERRIILSQYLLAINSCGSTPPQETGLTCNSWYGKMHLEMYLWHCAWAPLWNQTKLLERSLPWYVNHMEEAKANASRNGYKGCRWPKMIASDGIDCPSPIATLLVWQQPHIIFMLELCYRQNKSTKFLQKYWCLVEKTAEFMVDFVVFNEETGKYDIVAPVIPVQECHQPEVTKNPTFEVEYWRYTLKLAVDWAEMLDKEYDKKWSEVANNMAQLPTHDNLYLAHENCPDTFSKYNIDHPSMLQAYGVLPNETIESDIMNNTLKKVIDCWKYDTLWGWDFAVMAMTATRLNDPQTAIDMLLKETPKNDYVTSGHNRQILRNDLPLYLPGNGAMLLAIPIMVAGYEGCTEKTPGFPKDGMWTVKYENIERYV